MESGRDMVVGGAKYNATGSAIVGVGTLADSLSAIKYLVFDKGVCTARELYDAVMANWEGYETLRHRAATEPPRFGNGDLYVDDLAAWMSGLYTAKTATFVGPRGGTTCGSYSAGGNLAMGMGTYATPNGRRAYDVVSDGASPTHGADTNGPTGVSASIISLHPENYKNGLQFCMRFHPSSVRGDEGVQKLRTFILTFFEQGGMQMQINVVSSNTLRAAQRNPEEYRDLVIRVAGFSAYFVELYEGLQDDIIARTDNMF
jgi:formate C-acetyltransferase